jgi:hypothetical protein
MLLDFMVNFNKYLQGNIAGSSSSTAQATLASRISSAGGRHVVIDCCPITGREGVGCVATFVEFLDGGKG